MAKAAKKHVEKKVVEVKVVCVESFRDKYTNNIHKKDDVFTVTEDRFAEILSVGKFVKKITEPDPAEGKAE